MRVRSRARSRGGTRRCATPVPRADARTPGATGVRQPWAAGYPTDGDGLTWLCVRRDPGRSMTLRNRSHLAHRHRYSVSERRPGVRSQPSTPSWAVFSWKEPAVSTHRVGDHRRRRHRSRGDRRSRSTSCAPPAWRSTPSTTTSAARATCAPVKCCPTRSSRSCAATTRSSSARSGPPTCRPASSSAGCCCGCASRSTST